MNVLGKIFTGIILASASVVGIAAFFEARDNRFAYDLSSKTKQNYIAAQKAEYGDIFAQQKEKMSAILNKDKISSVADAQAVLGVKFSPYNFITGNNQKNTRPLFSFENQIGEDKYFTLEENFSPVKLREMKKAEQEKYFEKMKAVAALSNTQNMREFDIFNLKFANELRKYVEKNPKRFYEGESLDSVTQKMQYMDFLQVLEKVIMKSVAEKTKAKENTPEFGAAFAEVASTYFVPAIWTANQISLTNKNFVIE